MWAETELSVLQNLTQVLVNTLLRVGRMSLLLQDTLGMSTLQSHLCLQHSSVNNSISP